MKTTLAILGIFAAAVLVGMSQHRIRVTSAYAIQSSIHTKVGSNQAGIKTNKQNQRIHMAKDNLVYLTLKRTTTTKTKTQSKSLRTLPVSAILLKSESIFFFFLF